MAGPVTTWNATIAMPIFASDRASRDADEAQAVAVVENEFEVAQVPQQDSFGIEAGSFVVMGALAAASLVYLWRTRRLTVVSERMHDLIKADLLKLQPWDQGAIYVKERFAALDAQSPDPFLGFEQEMFRSCVLVFNCDLKKQTLLRNAGPAAFLMEYWKARGQTRNVRAMKKVLHAVSIDNLERAAAYHADLAARLQNASSPLTAGDLLAKAIHETAAAQLYYRRGLYMMMVEGKERVVSAASHMIGEAEQTVVRLKNRWATRIQLLSMPIEELKMAIAQEMRDMTSGKNKPGKWTVGPCGSIPQGRPPSRNTGSSDPTGPMGAAFSGLRSFLGFQPSSPVQQYVHNFSFGRPMALIMSPRR